MRINFQTFVLLTLENVIKYALIVILCDTSSACIKIQQKIEILGYKDSCSGKKILVHVAYT